MTDLLTRLEQAEGPAYVLDVMISDAAGVPKTVSDGVQTYPVDPLLYTASLDAKLPWENIIATEYHWRTEDWTADHQEEDGLIVRGHAKTEVLARRIAALKARG